MNLIRTSIFSFFFIVFQSLFIYLNATNYYLDNAGNDSNTGKSPITAWKTINKLNLIANNILPGDSILFKRGCTFYGQIQVERSGTSGKLIVLGAYGSGSKPIISAAVLLRGWNVYAGQIYSIASNDSIRNLFVDDTPMQIARYPNNGWLFTDTYNGLLGFSDNALNQSDGYWNNSTIHIRSINWAYETRKVGSFSNKNILFNKPLLYNLQNNLGYFFDNSFSELDTAKEWFYNKSEKKLYFIPPQKINPESINIFGTIFDYGIKTNWKVSYIVIRDLCFKMQAISGIWFGGEGTDIQIINNDLINCTTGLDFNGNPIKNTLISGNSISESKARGIFFYSAENSKISNNIIQNIGLQPGYGIDGVNGAIGICLTGFSKNSTISFNQVENTGYSGIRCDGINTTTNNNIVKNTMLTLADGAAIYCWGDITSKGKIVNNFIENVKGNNESCPDLPAIPIGIYLDENSDSVSILGNTVENVKGSGILIHNSGYNNISDNTVFNSNGIDLAEDISNRNIHNSLSNNVFYGLSESQIPLKIRSASTTPDFGIMNNNYYCNPYNRNVILFINNNYVESRFGLNHWKNFTKQDQNSQESPFQWNKLIITDTIGIDKIINSTFDTDISSWGKWPTTNIIQWTKNTTSSGCLKFTATTTDANTFCRIYCNTFSLEQNKYYQFSFNIIGTNYAAMRILTVGADALQYSCYFPVEAGNKYAYSTIFKPETSVDNVRFDLETLASVTSFNVDDVHLFEVTGSDADPTQKSFLFKNATNAAISVNLQNASFQNLDGKQISGSINLDPWQSKILVLTSGQFNSNYETEVENYFSVYPNPVIREIQQAYLLISLKNEEPINLSIIDLSGKIRISIPDFDVNTAIPILNLPKGMYLISIKSSNYTAVKKILIL